MAFRLIQNLAAGGVEVAPPKDLEYFQLDDAEDGYVGRVYKFSGGKLVLADGNNESAVAVVSLENVDGDTPGEYMRAYWILPGMVFKAPITAKDGTAIGESLDSNVVAGATVTINDTGTGVDGATDNSSIKGPLTVLKVDEDNDVIYVAFNTCALSLDVS
jgi:hypothetical protein